MLLNIVYCTRRGRRWRRIKGIGSSQGLSPSKFKTGVRNKCLTPVNSPLILIPITATIRTRQIFFVITVLFFNIVLCKGKGRVGGDRGIWCRRVFEVITVRFKYCVLPRKRGGEIDEISYRNLVY